MNTVNKATLLGNLGTDPEVRTTSSGTKVATLSLATSWKRDGKEKTAWHRVVLWEQKAELAEEYLAKGDRVYIEGRIQYRQWEGQDGHTRYTTEIVANNIVFLGSSESRSMDGRTREKQPVASDGDLPF